MGARAISVAIILAINIFLLVPQSHAGDASSCKSIKLPPGSGADFFYNNYCVDVEAARAKSEERRQMMRSKVEPDGILDAAVELIVKALLKIISVGDTITANLIASQYPDLNPASPPEEVNSLIATQKAKERFKEREIGKLRAVQHQKSHEGEPFPYYHADLNDDGSRDWAFVEPLFPKPGEPLYLAEINVITSLPGSSDFTRSFNRKLPNEHWIAFRDFTNDGVLDLGIYALDGNLVEFHAGYGDGKFSVQPMQASSDYNSIAYADFNGDRLLDEVSSGPDENYPGQDVLLVRLRNRSGTYSQPTWSLRLSQGTPVSVLDFNGDRKLDLRIYDPKLAGGVRYFRGNGNGTFSDPRAENVYVDFYSGDRLERGVRACVENFSNNTYFCTNIGAPNQSTEGNGTANGFVVAGFPFSTLYLNDIKPGTTLMFTISGIFSSSSSASSGGIRLRIADWVVAGNFVELRHAGAVLRCFATISATGLFEKTSCNLVS